jgi:hypothetical protein
MDFLLFTFYFLFFILLALDGKDSPPVPNELALRLFCVELLRAPRGWQSQVVLTASRR